MLFTILTLNNLDLDYVRNSFNEVSSIDDIEILLDILKSDSSIESQGYSAALIMTKSRYYKSPLKKLKYFNEGKKALELLIYHNKQSLELRYLRFSIQNSVPKFLGYNANLHEDLALLKKQLALGILEKSTSLIILKNLLNSNTLSQKDYLYFNEIKNAL